VTRAIVFDYGGVLSHGQPTWDLLASFEAQLGWPAGSLAQRLFAGEAWELVSTGAISPEEHWEQVGVPLEPLLPPEFGKLRGDPFYLDELNQGVVELASWARLHFKVALCSNAMPSLMSHLQKNPDVLGLFDTVVISALVGLRKPDPAIFDLTAERLGLSLADCMLVDDKERNVSAARGRGMAGYLFTSASDLATSMRRWPASGWPVDARGP